LNQEAEATHSLAPTRAELCNVRVSTKVEVLLHRLETPKRLELRPRRFEASMSMRASPVGQNYAKQYLRGRRYAPLRDTLEDDDLRIVENYA